MLRVSITVLLLSVGIYYYMQCAHLPEAIAGPERTRIVILERLLSFALLPSDFCLYLGFEDCYVSFGRAAFGFLSKLKGGLSLNDDSLTNDITQTTDVALDGVPARIYTPRQRRHTGALIYIHGGGFVFLNVDQFDPLTRHLATQLDSVVISIDYRLAPEHPFPAALDDCLRAVQHIAENAAEFNVDPTRLVVSGDSAGGNLAALVAQRYESAKYPIAAQALIYPVMQIADISLPSYVSNDVLDKSHLLTASELIRWYLLYFGVDRRFLSVVLNNSHVDAHAWTSERKRIGSHDHLPERFRSVKSQEVLLPNTVENRKLVEDARVALSPFVFSDRFSPLYAEKLPSRLPPAYVIAAEYDVLRDEDVLYVERLKSRGTKVEYKFYSGSFHGMFSLFGDFTLGRRMVEDYVHFVSKYL